MLPGFKSRWTSGSGFVWCKKRRPVAISAAIWNLSCHGRAARFPLRNKQSSKLPFAINHIILPAETVGVLELHLASKPLWQPGCNLVHTCKLDRNLLRRS
ncbi:hypothetical protein CR513_26233, partial [Mucuna pruriens]